MSRSRRRLVTAAATAAIASSFNPNAPRSAAYPGQRAAHDPTISALVHTAIKFWTARGVAVPANLAVDVADKLDGAAAGRGMDQKTYGDARLILNGRTTGQELLRSRSSHQTTQARREAIMRLGQTITHEIGHASGLPHSAGGIMAPMASRDDVPWDVQVEARKLVPKIRGLKQRRRARAVGTLDW